MPSSAVTLDSMVEHVVYEISMLVELHRWFACDPRNALNERVIANARLESFVMHARVLDDFLTLRRSRSEPDDLFASDYAPNWKPSTSHALSSEMKRRMHKQVAHLSFSRTDHNIEWPIYSMLQTLEARYRDFAHHVQDPRIREQLLAPLAVLDYDPAPIPVTAIELYLTDES